MITVMINGERCEFPKSASLLEEVVKALGLEPKTLLIEHNGEALTRAEWQERAINEGDALEILRISAGG